MPNLNWVQSADSQVKLSVVEEGAIQSLMNRQPSLRLSLGLAPSEWAAFISGLDSPFGSSDVPPEGRAELRLDLPGGWSLYFKLREGESRMLMARPEPDQWVVNISLNLAHGLELVQALKSLPVGSEYAVDSLRLLGSWNATSNFGLTLSQLVMQ